MNMFNQEILFSPKECEFILESTDNDYKKSETELSRKRNKQSEYRTSSESLNEINESLKILLLNKLSKLDVIDLPTHGHIIRYNHGEYFKIHSDRGAESSDRFKTLIIQLSDDSDYSGGDLIIYDESKQPIVCNKKIGNTIMFDSQMLHEVTPIIKGTRYVFIAWLRSNDFNFKKGLL